MTPEQPRGLNFHLSPTQQVRPEGLWPLLHGFVVTRGVAAQMLPKEHILHLMPLQAPLKPVLTAHTLCHRFLEAPPKPFSP